MEFNQNKELLSNTLALNVALQTIKERCVHLQKRLYSLESENSKLRLNSLNNDKTNESRRDNSLIAELEEMRAKNAELTLQKTQLTENLSMISTENKKLWKRLSSLTKQNANDSEHARQEDESEESGTKLHANLIRSKTFTQNSPHQLLREKMAANHVPPEQDDLEDISLLNDCGFATTDKLAHETNEAETCDIDSRACTEGLLNIKKELLKQNSDLKVALSTWRKLKSSDLCSCKSTVRSDKKPLMVDKSLGTDRDITLEFEIDPNSPNNNFELPKHDNYMTDLIEQQKKEANGADKICPMCGKFYTQNILFEEFQEHVESHFLDDNDIEHSIDHNFELVSHTVGNF